MLLLIILVLIAAAALGYYAGKYFPPVLRILPPVLFFFSDSVLYSLSHHMTATFIVPVGIYLIAAYIGKPEKTKKSRAIYNLDWYLLIAAVLIVCVLASIRPGPLPKRMICRSNLKMIALAMVLYEQDNNNWPEAFSDITTYLDTPKIMTCPSDANKPGDLADVDDWTNYVFVPRDANLPASQAVIAYCPHDHNHKDVRNAAFADGRVDQYPIVQITGEAVNSNHSKP